MGIRFISKSFYKKLIKKLTSQGPTNAILKSTFQQPEFLEKTSFPVFLRSIM